MSFGWNCFKPTKPIPKKKKPELKKEDELKEEDNKEPYFVEGNEHLLKKINSLPKNFLSGDYELDFKEPKALSILLAYFDILNEERLEIDREQNYIALLISLHIDQKKQKENLFEPMTKFYFSWLEFKKTFEKFGLLDYAKKFIQ